jgi:hypothetical protein
MQTPAEKQAQEGILYKHDQYRPIFSIYLQQLQLDPTSLFKKTNYLKLN